jgi:hypothetical protein
MSHEADAPAYNPIAIKAWGILSCVVGVILFGMFVFGNEILAAGKPVWDLIRWLASPFI